ncbi:hypothetical protein ACFVMC_26470 [Nocardia sp. NPDC127579]|uniref:hypothetical protein n=1 Tax=Nocardia sp. NPDC127579 TaxID=3345402 RepID=UPI0036422BA2
MIDSVRRTAFVSTGLCALMLGAAPLAQAQPDEGSPENGKAAGPPASTADTQPGELGIQREVKISVENLGNFTGTVYFAPPGPNHGGFVFNGTTHDTSNNDDEVYLEVAVEGYSPNEFRNPVDKDKNWNQVVWDYQAVHTDNARMRICNSDFAWDTCSDWQSFKR